MAQQQKLTNSFKLGLCQFMVTDDKEYNLQNAFNFIKRAVDAGADLIVLPEIFNAPYSNDCFPVFAERLPDINTMNKDIDKKTYPSTYMLSNAAKLFEKYIIGGTMPEEVYDSDGIRKIYNTCLVFNIDGDIIGKYSKMHLFDIDAPGKFTFYESKTLSAGNKFGIVEIEGITLNKFKIGIGICYDVRFSELAEIYRQNGCSIIIYPAAFNCIIGPLHFNLMQTTRAIDNQLYVAACAPATNLNVSNKYHTHPIYGHSIIVDPSAQIVNQLDEKEGILVETVNLNLVNKVRESIPIWKQKRYDMYQPINIVSKL